MDNKILYSTQVFGITINKYKGSLIELVYPDDFEVNLEMVIQVDKLVADIVQGQKFVLLLNFKDRFGTMSQEAQIYFAEKVSTADQIIANAIIINNLPMRMLVNFYLRFKRPIYPSKSFSTLEEAKTWLNERMELFNQSYLSA